MEVIRDEDKVTFIEDDIEMIMDWEAVIFKKNGLKIEIPYEVYEKFAKGVEKVIAELDLDIDDKISKLFKPKI